MADADADDKYECVDADATRAAISQEVAQHFLVKHGVDIYSMDPPKLRRFLNSVVRPKKAGFVRRAAWWGVEQVGGHLALNAASAIRVASASAMILGWGWRIGQMI